MKSRNYRILFVFAIFVGIVVGLIIASNFDMAEQGVAASEGSGETPALSLGSSEPVPQELLGLENLSKAFVKVAEEVSPAVVTINSQAIVRTRNPFYDDEFFRYFFRMPEQQEQVRRGLGSGVIVNADGYILTNNHVVSEADEVTVVFKGEEYDAEIVGTDPESDLAVIKIDKKDLPTLKLGDSEELKVGEWVLAIGNPFSDILQHTVTSGIVSAKGRSNLPIGGNRSIQYQDFIQTDAAINPGNSGGALVNLRGELVGINTAILGQANVGIGFAIPVNLAKDVMEQLISEGRVVRGYLGVMIESVDEDMAQAFDRDNAGGALVQRVVEDSPAEKGGIEPGDIILEVEGTEISDSNHLTNLIAGYEPDTKVDMVIWRDGKRKKISVSLDERPTSGEPQAQPASQDVTEELGLEVQTLTSQLARRFGYEAEEGVLITDVRRGSVASREGLRAGDLVLSVSRKPVTNEREFYQIVEKAGPNEILLFRLKRDNMSFFRTLRVPKDRD